MSDALWLWAAGGLSWLGMAALALAMPVHWHQFLGAGVAQRRVTRHALRGAGATCLALSLWACMRADHPSMAALVWVMWLTVSAFTVACTLSRLDGGRPTSGSARSTPAGR